MWYNQFAQRRDRKVIVAIGGAKMNKKILKIIAGAQMITLLSTPALAGSHIVKKGDTLWKISNKYSVSLNSIIDSNEDIQDPSVIYPGQIIKIPEPVRTVSDYEQEVVDLVNEIRTQRGLRKLTLDEQLSEVARKKSEDMKQNHYFDHQSPTYGSPFDMMRKFGISYRSAAENIAKGQTTPQAVVNAWMSSSGHRKNILGESYTHIGVGHVKSGNYWTQMFIGK